MVKVLQKTDDLQKKIENFLDESYRTLNLILYKMIETKNYVILYLKEDIV